MGALPPTVGQPNHRSPALTMVLSKNRWTVIIIRLLTIINHKKVERAMRVDKGK